jgi:hypothetical protein
LVSVSASAGIGCIIVPALPLATVLTRQRVCVGLTVNRRVEAPAWLWTCGPAFVRRRHGRGGRRGDHGQQPTVPHRNPARSPLPQPCSSPGRHETVADASVAASAGQCLGHLLNSSSHGNTTTLPYLTETHHSKKTIRYFPLCPPCQVSGIAAVGPGQRPPPHNPLLPAVPAVSGIGHCSSGTWAAAASSTTCHGCPENRTRRACCTPREPCVGPVRTLIEFQGPY